MGPDCAVDTNSRVENPTGRNVATATVKTWAAFQPRREVSRTLPNEHSCDRSNSLKLVRFESMQMPSTQLFHEPVETINRIPTGASPLGQMLADSTSYPLVPTGAGAPSNTSVTWKEETAPLPAAPVPGPRSPRTISETGLSMGQLSDLLLKTLYVHGVLQ